MLLTRHLSDKSSLPHRQLRNPRWLCQSFKWCSLPHRQLRNLYSKINNICDSSLPHRQLRKHQR
ncbi:hypothetical protein P20652_3834 [Pseudoalteromonas sp. BSi20652]|nr:hypothetical protein P20652_3834 [Pseudoalteromonas sp. BSi20652]